MCNIIHKPAGVVLSEKSIRATYTRNSDGFGYMYWDPEKKRIFAFKGMMSIQEILQCFKDTEKFDTVYHFRLRTHGAKDFERCHPFAVLKKSPPFNDPEDVYFVHNGVFQIPTEGQESDTMAFNRIHLQPLLKDGSDIIRNPVVQRLLKAFIGHNKLAFMHGEGEVTIINKELGDQYEGCWVSNKGSMTDTWSYANNRGHNSSKDGAKYFGKYKLMKGDKVHILHDRHDDYYAEGVVSTDNTSHSIDVEYTDRDGKVHKEARFLNDTGHCGEYFMIPENRSGPNMYASQTVADFEKSCTSQYPDPEESKKKSLTEEKTTTFTPTGTAVSKDVGNVVVTKFGKKKEEKMGSESVEKRASLNETCSTECGASFLQPLISDDINMVSDGLFNFNSKDNRWGGASLEGPDVEYGPVDSVSYSIRDLYNCTSQDRFDFFRSNPIISFAIFEDLIEKETLVADGFDGVEAKEQRQSSPLLLEHKKESTIQ